MKWKNHIDIANHVAEQLSLPPELRSILRKAVVQPDREGDKVVMLDRNALPFRERVRHHHAHRRFIRRLLWKARAAHIDGREEDAVWCLGRALHYVQDRSVAVGPLYIFHDRREEELGRRKAMPGAIHLGEECAVPSPLFVDLCLRRTCPKGGTGPAMFQACLMSSALSSAVLCSPYAGPELEARSARAIHRHRRLVRPLALAAALAGGLALLLVEPLTAPVCILVGLLVLRCDRQFYHLQRERAWFAPSRPVPANGYSHAPPIQG